MNKVTLLWKTLQIRKLRSTRAENKSADGAKTWKSYLWKLAKAAVTGEGE